MHEPTIETALFLNSIQMRFATQQDRVVDDGEGCKGAIAVANLIGRQLGECFAWRDDGRLSGFTLEIDLTGTIENGRRKFPSQTLLTMFLAR